jgi:pSer/pThr/pTyr-binding forkhead associated (FHA) protein
VTAGPLSGTTLPLRPAGTLIGRSPECALVLDDDYASGRHARIYQDDDGTWKVEDLRSTNGTFLGATRLTEPREVAVGSVLRIGQTVVELQR